MFLGSQVAVIDTEQVKHLWMVSASLGFAYGSLFNALPMLVLEWFGMSKCLLVHRTGATLGVREEPDELVCVGDRRCAKRLWMRGRGAHIVIGQCPIGSPLSGARNHVYLSVSGDFGELPSRRAGASGVSGT